MMARRERGRSCRRYGSRISRKLGSRHKTLSTYQLGTLHVFSAKHGFDPSCKTAAEATLAEANLVPLVQELAWGKTIGEGSVTLAALYR